MAHLLFLLLDNSDKIIPKHNKFPNNRKVMPYHILPTALPVGVYRLMPSSGGISPLTCTIFDPSIFLRISGSTFFHISSTRLKYLVMGNYFDFGIKIAHRGNIGSYKGKRKLFGVPERCICALLLFFLCFWSMA